MNISTTSPFYVTSCSILSLKYLLSLRYKCLLLCVWCWLLYVLYYRADNDDYSPANLQTCSDSVYLNLFDEVVVDIQSVRCSFLFIVNIISQQQIHKQLPSLGCRIVYMLCVLHQYSVTSTSCIQPKLGVSIYTDQYGPFSTVEEPLRMINDNQWQSISMLWCVWL